ncbi:MAG TPA: MarR family winged helix-turn-helix transcriptional regulator [Deltaproteobacteria bacterium]|nr:MarR family winged helix-turn-helix transcriptional regulator [Deltaproteobacteria bacterium]
MDNKTPSPFSVIGKFTRIVKIWQKIEKMPRRFGIDEDLHSSEIHTIEVIGTNSDFSVTGLARLLGVTKGAVSQTLKKLENKGLVEKYADPENNSRVLIKLSSKGMIAYYAHEHWHETMDGGFREYFTTLPEDRIRFLDEFLTTLEEFLEKRQ